MGGPSNDCLGQDARPQRHREYAGQDEHNVWAQCSIERHCPVSAVDFKDTHTGLYSEGCLVESSFALTNIFQVLDVEDLARSWNLVYQDLVVYIYHNYLCNPVADWTGYAAVGAEVHGDVLCFWLLAER